MKTQIETTCSREQISSLADGELAPAELDAVLPALQAAEARECWHLYQLIGDVLRAPDLAACDRGPTLDLALGEQLHPAIVSVAHAAEPLPAETRARPAANDGLFRWKMAAGLASFAAVAALGWGLSGSLGPAAPAGAELALVQPPAAKPVDASPVQVVSAPELAVRRVNQAAPVMIRDPELDRLLAVHQQSAGVAAFGNPSGFLRSATFEGAGR